MTVQAQRARSLVVGILCSVRFPAEKPTVEENTGAKEEKKADEGDTGSAEDALMDATIEPPPPVDFEGK